MRLMKKKVISKKRYRLWNVAYIFLCLSGLSWQLVTITRKFFEFGSVSNILIHLPGSEMMKTMYVCYYLTDSISESDAIDYLSRKMETSDCTSHQMQKARVQLSGNYRLKSYNRCHFEILRKNIQMKNFKMGMQYFTNFIVNIRDMLNMTSKKIYCPDYLTYNTTKSTCHISKFIYAPLNFLCYRIDHLPRKEIDKTMRFRGDRIDAITRVLVFPGKYKSLFRIILSSPDHTASEDIEQARFHIIEGKDVQFDQLSSTTFSISKLPHPYNQRCIDYTKLLNLLDRKAAIISCVDTKLISRSSIPSGMKIDLSNTMYESYYLSNYRENSFKLQKRTFLEKCSEILPNPDCYEESTITEYKMFIPTLSHNMKYSNSTQKLEQVFSDSASYDVRYTPASAIIDFICFVFGCFGVWFGISFLSLNPLPLFLTTEEDKKPVINCADVDEFKNNYQHLMFSSIRHDSEMKKMEITIADQNTMMMMMKNTINFQKRKIEAIERRLNELEN